MANKKKYTDTTTTLQELKEYMGTFVEERDWTRFHSPKNLSMSMAIEAAELMEKFQFLTNEESYAIAESHKEEVAHELVDVLAYMLSFANRCNIDISATYINKMKLNAQKYTVERSKGNFGKYTKLEKPVTDETIPSGNE